MLVIHPCRWDIHASVFLKGYSPIVRILVKVCYLEALDDHLISPLFLAAQYGQRECLQVLISAGIYLSYNNFLLSFFSFSFCKYRADLISFLFDIFFFKDVFKSILRNNLHILFYFFDLFISICKLKDSDKLLLYLHNDIQWQYIESLICYI